MKKKLLALILLISLVVVFPLKTYAFSFNDLLNSAKNLIMPSPTQSNDGVMVSDTVTPASGSSNVVSGDALYFTYTIRNSSDTSYTDALLKTNLSKKQIYYVRDVQGALSYALMGNALVFPRLSLLAHQQLTISFEANVVENTAADTVISTQPQVFTSSNQQLFGAGKFSLTAKKHALPKGGFRTFPFGNAL